MAIRVFEVWRLGIVLTVLLLPYTRADAQTSCSPSNWTKITNNAPLPSDFCAYTYLPFRVTLPANPQHKDATNSTIFQNQYLPNSPPGQIYTIAVKPDFSQDQGNSGYPWYKASTSDPLVSVDCASSIYGCSDSYGNRVGSLPHFRIPPWARSSCQGACDPIMSIIQPDGTVMDLEGVRTSRDWQNGDVIAGYTTGLGGATGGNLVTDPGVNAAVLNGGNNFLALPVHYTEVVNGHINHALLVWGGCFTGVRYPAFGPSMACNSPPGIPAGSHMWLDIPCDQIQTWDTNVIPPHMRVFACAAHEHGMFAMDTGNGEKWITEPALEQGMAFLESGAGSLTFWTPWFSSINAAGVYGDGNYKTNYSIDWSRLTSHMWILDGCYAYGTCSDSVPEGAGTGPTASLVADHTSITVGQSAMLTWSSSNVTSCTGANFSTGGATQGSVSVSPAFTTTYSVTCSGTGGSATSAPVQITVTVPPTQGTFWVDAVNGNDGMSCAQAKVQGTPKKTLASTLPCILGGSTITLRAGTYPERLDSNALTIPGGTDWAHKTLITRYQQEAVTLRPGSGNAPVVQFLTTTNQFIELFGLTLDLTGVTGANAVLVQGPAASVRLNQTTVTGAPSDRAAVYIFNSANDEIIHSTLTGNGTLPIYVDGTSSNTLIDSNTITAYGGGGGVEVDQTASGVLISANYIHDPGVGSSAVGIRLKNTASVLVRNNILANLPGGIQITLGSAGGNTGSKLYNNTLSNAATYGINLDASVTTVDIQNNILSGPTTVIQANTASVTFGANLCTVAGTGCALVQNPQFTNAAGGDYTIPAFSPAVDKGTTLADVPTDALGVARPQPPGGAYDIGAYEVLGGVGTPPNPRPPLPASAAFFNACLCTERPASTDGQP